jgi:amidohydrolase
MALCDAQRAGGLPWSVHVRGIFQPAEEICVGATEMIKAGALDGVNAILALHVDPSLDVGRISVRAGVLTANCDDMRLKIVGRGGHAARPHEASDPIVAAAQLISSLYMFVPRATDSRDAVVLTIGQITGANTPNAIPERVELRGTLRTLDRGVRERTIEHIRRLADGIGQASGTQIAIRFGLGAASIRNDGQLVRLLREVGHDVVGKENILEIPHPSMGSEDFAFYLERVPGAMFRLGCASSKVGNASLHTPTFDVDDEALRVGARMLAGCAVMWSRPCGP